MQRHQCEQFLAPRIATITAHTMLCLPLFIMPIYDNSETHQYIHRDWNRRFFDRTKAVGVQIRTTGAHIHARTAVGPAYGVPTASQIKSTKAQYHRTALTGILKTG